MSKFSPRGAFAFWIILAGGVSAFLNSLVDRQWLAAGWILIAIGQAWLLRSVLAERDPLDRTSRSLSKTK